MAQQRKGIDMDPPALVLSIPTSHLFAFQCLQGRTRLEQTWDQWVFPGWLIMDPGNAT